MKFDAVNQPVTLYCRVSYLEIYNETMFDLLSTLPETLAENVEPAPLTIVEDEHAVYVKGLSCHLAQSEEEALNLLFEVSSLLGPKSQESRALSYPTLEIIMYGPISLNRCFWYSLWVARGNYHLFLSRTIDIIPG